MRSVGVGSVGVDEVAHPEGVGEAGYWKREGPNFSVHFYCSPETFSETRCGCSTVQKNLGDFLETIICTVNIFDCSGCPFFYFGTVRIVQYRKLLTFRRKFCWVWEGLVSSLLNSTVKYEQMRWTNDTETKLIKTLRTATVVPRTYDHIGIYLRCRYIYT